MFAIVPSTTSVGNVQCIPSGSTMGLAVPELWLRLSHGQHWNHASLVSSTLRTTTRRITAMASHLSEPQKTLSTLAYVRITRSLNPSTVTSTSVQRSMTISLKRQSTGTDSTNSSTREGSGRILLPRVRMGRQPTGSSRPTRPRPERRQSTSTHEYACHSCKFNCCDNAELERHKKYPRHMKRIERWIDAWECKTCEYDDEYELGYKQHKKSKGCKRKRVVVGLV